MPHGQRYRLEIEHSKTVLVDCHSALSPKIGLCQVCRASQTFLQRSAMWPCSASAGSSSAPIARCS